MSGWIKGNPWIVTKKDCGSTWGGGFNCRLCGHKFKEGETARFQLMNKIKNALLCNQCDTDDVVEKLEDQNKFLKLSNLNKYKKIQSLIRDNNNLREKLSDKESDNEN